MANILLIETAANTCSIGLCANEQLKALHETEAYNEHGKKITLLIKACLDESKLKASELDAIAVSSGPGSFTSLRIGIATAKGLCYGLNKPLISVDTLQSIAMAAVEPNDPLAYYIPMIDARSMGVFFSIHDKTNKVIKPISREKLDQVDLHEILASDQKIFFCGPAAKKYEMTIRGENIFHRPNITNSAKNLIPFALKAYNLRAWENLAYYEPNYLAPPNITVSNKKLRKKPF